MFRRGVVATPGLDPGAGTTAGAEATGKATGGRTTWLRTECRDGKTAEAERPAGSGETVGSQSLHSTEAAETSRRGGEQNRLEGREAGSWMREVEHGARESRQCRRG
jgi:hypothetical protein